MLDPPGHLEEGQVPRAREAHAGVGAGRHRRGARPPARNLRGQDALSATGRAAAAEHAHLVHTLRDVAVLLSCELHVIYSSAIHSVE